MGWKFLYDYDSIPFDVYLILRKEVHTFSLSVISNLIVKRYYIDGSVEQERFIVHGIDNKVVYNFYISGHRTLVEVLERGIHRRVSYSQSL